MASRNTEKLSMLLDRTECELCIWLNSVVQQKSESQSNDAFDTQEGVPIRYMGYNDSVDRFSLQPTEEFYWFTTRHFAGYIRGHTVAMFRTYREQGSNLNTLTHNTKVTC